MFRKLFTILLAISFLLVNKVSAEQSPQWVKTLTAANNANQLLIVAQVGEKTTAWISMHNRDANGNWQQIMTTPGFIGKNGLGKEREGDNKTPVGVFHFDKAFGIAANPGCKVPYTQVDENYYWSSDPNYKYNQFVSIKDFPALNKNAAEHLIECEPEYTYVLNISYNEQGTPAKGSAIFLQCLGINKTYTHGGIAIPVDKMRVVMQNLNPDCVLIIDSLANLGGSVE